MTGLPPPEAVIRAIDGFLDGPPVESLGLDLKPFLIVERYLSALGRTPAARGPLHRLRAQLRSAALRVLPAAALGPPVVELRRVRPGPGPRHLFVFGLPWSDQGYAGFNIGVIRALADPARAVVVTADRACFDQWCREGVDAVLLTARARRLDPAHRFAGARTGEPEKLTRAAALLRSADALLEALAPVSVSTTQDYHVYDQAFARAARRRGIPTLTHQHGLIPDRAVTLYKYVFSDRIAVWGRRSARLMARWVPEDRIWVTGTDRFDGLRSDRPPGDRPILALGVNPIGEARDLAILGAVSAALRRVSAGPVGALRPVLKLHPSLDMARWEGHAARVGHGVPWEIRRAGNEVLLPLTRFMLAQRSTITLDAAVAGATVLELDPDPALGQVPGLFDTLPESVVAPAAAVDEVARRLADPRTEAALLARQSAALSDELEPGGASARIAAWLRSLEGATA
jgi:hypothetical protein